MRGKGSVLHLGQVKEKSVPNPPHFYVVKSQIKTASRMTYEEHLMTFLSDYSENVKYKGVLATEEISELFFCLDQRQRCLGI